MSDDEERTPPSPPPPSSPPIGDPPVSDGNDEFPIPFERFAASLAGTSDEIWTGILRMNHGFENHKPSEWHAMIDNYRHQPAHPSDPRFNG